MSKKLFRSFPKGKQGSPSGLALFLLTIALVLLLVIHPRGGGETRAQRLLERKSVLAPSLFAEQVALAYQVARDSPGLIDKFYCYCRCKENYGHKTLLTCFRSDHGANCSICVYQVLTARKLADEGKSVDEIREFFARRFEHKAQSLR